MIIPRFTARELKSILLYGLAGVVFYQIGVLLLFFVIPLFLLYLRYGTRAGLAGALVCFAGISAVSWVRAGLMLEWAVPLEALALGLSMPGAMLLGGIITASPRPKTLPRHFKLIAGSLAAAAGCMPLLFFVAGNGGFEGAMRLQLKALTAELGEGELTALAAAAENILWSSFAAGIFLTLGASWLFALRMQAKAAGATLEARIVAFRLPPAAVWPFLLGWAGVLAGLVLKQTLLGFVSWNCAIAVSALFGFQGYAVIRFWMVRVLKQERARVLVGGLLVMVLFIPGLNFVPLVMIPLLGVSEIWIDYRFQERRRDS